MAVVVTVVEVVQVVLVGLLAGAELVVRWGVQPALTSLPDDAHVRARVALVRRLKVVVPAVLVPAVLLSATLVVLVGLGAGLVWRVPACAALLTFLLAAFLGTVPINIGVNDWDPAHPPADWRRVVRRWERIDVLRSSAAAAAFVLFSAALVAR